MKLGYIWYIIITAIQLELDPERIHYTVKDHRVSPWAEYMPDTIAGREHPSPTTEEMSQVDINPFWRLDFVPIFEKILIPGRDDPNDAIICDLITHVLADVDRICGMCGRDFRVLLVMKDISDGCFGDKQTAALFSVFEKRALAEALIMLYKTSDSLMCLSNLFTMIMTDFVIRDRDYREIVFYNPNAFDEREDGKLRFIIGLFLPLDYSYAVHWRYTYGVIERGESMTLEAFVL